MAAKQNGGKKMATNEVESATDSYRRLSKKESISDKWHRHVAILLKRILNSFEFFSEGYWVLIWPLVCLERGLPSFYWVFY